MVCIRENRLVVGSRSGYESFDSRRLPRHDPHPGMFPQTRWLRCRNLERPRSGCRNPGQPAQGHRYPGPDPRAHENRQASARTAAQAQAHHPAQRLSAHRHRDMHETRYHRVLQPASGHAVLRRRGTDLGPGAFSGAANSSADGLAQGRRPGRSASVRRCGARRWGFTVTAGSAGRLQTMAGPSA